MLERAKDATHSVVSQVGEARRRRTAPLILELDLTEPLTESAPQDPVSAVVARRRVSMRVILDGLRRAFADPRVRALVVKLGGPRSPLGLARAQELRDAVRQFRAHDKLTVAWAETFGEFSHGTVAYYVATAFEQIWVQPSGDVCLTGVAVEVPFLRDALDKAGVDPQLAQRHEYKSAANIFTERGFTEAHREATARVVDSAMEQVVAGIAEGRHLDTGVVKALVDRAPLFASEALEAGLVDRLGYRDEVVDETRKQIDTEAILQYVGRYRRSKLAELSTRFGAHREVVAVIDVTGAIHLGKSRRSPLLGASAGADTVTGALRSAIKAHDVKAILLRVASPGGSYVACDAIWRHVGLARRAGKPVVVSMVDVAASGGYFVSMGADVIVAEPSTITGSIGVAAGKPVVERLTARLGIRHDHLAVGDHALMFSALHGFTDDEWARLNAYLDRIYDDFTAKVAKGRRLPSDRVHEVARGRVWTGADAKQRGLVDELGGLLLAIELAKQRAHLPPSAEPVLRTYPRRPLAAQLKTAHSSEDAPAASVAAADGWGAFAELAVRLGLPTSGPLTLVGDWRLVG
jgi:protease IV